MAEHDGEREDFEQWRTELWESIGPIDRVEPAHSDDPALRPDHLGPLVWGLVAARLLGQRDDAEWLLSRHVDPIIEDARGAAALVDEFVIALLGAVLAAGAIAEVDPAEMLRMFALTQQVNRLTFAGPSVGSAAPGFDELIDAEDVEDDPGWVTNSYPDTVAELLDDLDEEQRAWCLNLNRDLGFNPDLDDEDDDR